MSALGARGQEICSQVSAAFVKKGDLDSFWQSVAENFYPERADFTLKRSLGEDVASGLYASEPIIARRDFSNYLGSAIRPKGRVWWKPKPRDEEIASRSDVQSYLERRGMATFNRMKDWRSNFIKSATAAEHDYATFGNAVRSIEERPDRLGLRYRTWHLRDCAWRENYDGEVDTMFRKVVLPVHQLMSRERVGWSLHPKIREKAIKNPEDKIECYHVLMPVWDYDPNRRQSKGLDFVSCYVDMGNQWCMWEKDVPIFNYSVSRWFTIDGSPYAFSPAVICALPDARSLQVMTWSIMEAGEKAVEPPMIGVEEVIQGGVDIRAGAVTWIDKRYDERTGEALRAIEMGGSPQFGEVLREGIRGNLKDAWYLSRLFLPEAGPQMTAQEIQRRHEEWLRVAQPIIEPAEPELAGRVLDATMQLEMHIGLWGDAKKMPEPLRGRMVDFGYDNPLEDARKQSATNAFRSMIETTAMGREAFGDAVLKHIDADTAFREAVAGVAPPNWLVPEDQAMDDAEEQREGETLDKGVAQLAAVSQAQTQVAANQAKVKAMAA